MSIIAWLHKLILRPDPTVPRLRRRRAKSSCRLYLEELETRLTPATTLSIANASHLEPGPGGTVNMDFTVNRSGDLTSVVTVGFTTVAGTAHAGTDFTPTTGTTTFASGAAAVHILIPIKGNGVFNSPNLTFSVKLTGVTNVVGPAVTLANHSDFASVPSSAPIFVASGDLNGDGKADLVVVNDGNMSVSVLLNSTAPGASTPTFAAQQPFTVGSLPISVAIGDLNGDGLADLAVANLGDSTVSVLLNTTAPGSLVAGFATHVDFATGSAPFSVAIGDLNGDGKADLVVANHLSSTVSVLRNTTATGVSTPAFAAKQDFATGMDPRAVAIGELNGDGKLDIVTANFGGNSASVLLNTTATGATTFAFSANQDFTTAAPFSVAIGDLNGDGKADLAVANEASDNVSVLRNTTATGATTPSFAAKQDFATGLIAHSVAIGDLNGDGKRDLVVANNGSNSVSVLRNTTKTGATTFTFSAHTDFSTGAGNPRVAALGDFNGDGKLDVAVANFLNANVSVFLNTTVLGASAITPAFPENATPAAGSGPVFTAVGDLNGDGKPDMVVANNNAGTVSVLLNTTTPGAATPTFAIHVDFTVAGLPRSIALADLNGDGKLDIMTSHSIAGVVSVLMNTTNPGAATPTFDTHVDFGAGSFPVFVAAGDVNGDGKPDLVVADNAGQAVVRLNTTTPGAAAPTFTAGNSFAVGASPNCVALGDLNGDGRPDLALTNGPDNTVSVLLNTTTPGALTATFTTHVDFATGLKPIYVAIGDLNGDGKPDLAVANHTLASVSILRNTTTTGTNSPTFAAKQDVATGPGPQAIVIADLNGDGKLDLAIARNNNGPIVEVLSVLTNITTPGATTFAFASRADFGALFPVSVAVGDFNGDGRPDLAVANTVDTGILMNTPVTIAHGTATGTIIDSDPPTVVHKPIPVPLPGFRRRWGKK